MLVLPPAAPCCPPGSSGVAPVPLHGAPPPDEGRSGSPELGGEARPLARSRGRLPERSASVLADATAVDPQAVRDMQDQMREQDEVHLVSR